MSENPAPLNRQTLRRFGRAVKDLLTSEVRRRAICLLVLLVVFAMSVNGLNVVNSYVGRDFMTAIAHRDMSTFTKLSLIYVGVFAVTTAVAVYYRFTEERLGLLWRSWLTRRVTERYLERREYLLLKEITDVDNPDQRIAEDVRTFTTTTLSFTLIGLNATLAAVSFSGVLWAISPLLFGVAVGYAAIGTLATIYLGRPLVGLNYRQSDHEADFRATLMHVRENAEAIAVARGEGRLKARLLRRIDDLVRNFRRITSVNRNLGFFTTGYNYLIQIIPTLIIAPSFIRGEIEFGVITQAAMAFAQLLGAFSLIVNQIGSISSFAAVVARLGVLAEAMDSTQTKPTTLEVIDDQNRVAVENLTLCSQQDGSPLLSNLTLSVSRGTNLLVTGTNDAARIALFRTLVGIGRAGEGRVYLPPPASMLCLPQRPYLTPGTLRDALSEPGSCDPTTDLRIWELLRQAGLEPLVDRVGGLDVEVNWADRLSLGEQQQLAVVAVLLASPVFVVLDRVSTTLNLAQLRQTLVALRKHSVSYITFEESSETIDLHDAVLELSREGQWRHSPVAAG